MKRIAVLIIVFASVSSFAQSIESITQKVSDKICECMSEDMSSYADIKPEFNRCYDKEFNMIFNHVDADEQKILLQDGALTKISDGIIPVLDTSCEKVKSIIESDLNETADSVSTTEVIPCPTNFTGKDIKKIKKRNGEIVAFNAMVSQVQNVNNKPYYEVKLEGGSTIWIASLVNSGFEIEGKILRIIGYVSEVGSDEHAEKHNKAGFHILAFGVMEMESQQMAMMPGSELQIKEWINGSIPKAE